MTCGIYCYIDKKYNKIVYIGKDSNIHKNKRHTDHLYPSNYKKQKINQVLQNNPQRYIYQILVRNVNNEYILNALEIQYIRTLNPKFNFTEGGEGVKGWKHSEEARRKMSENHADFRGEKSPNFGKKLSLETRRKISESQKGRVLSKEHKKKLSQNNARFWKGKKRDSATKRQISKTLSDKYNTTGFFRVSKEISDKFKKGFRWYYSYYKNNKRTKLSSVDLIKLEEKVKKSGQEWRIIDEEKAKQSIEEDNGSK